MYFVCPFLKSPHLLQMFEFLHLPLQADEVNLSGYENDPAVGKYVNQDGLQQLRHYLKVGPYKTYLTGSNKAFMGYMRQVWHKRKRDLLAQSSNHLPGFQSCDDSETNMTLAFDNSTLHSNSPLSLSP